MRETHTKEQMAESIEMAEALIVDLPGMEYWLRPLIRSGRACASLPDPEVAIPALIQALRDMTALYDGLDNALVHQRVMDKVTAARAALALVQK